MTVKEELHHEIESIKDETDLAGLLEWLKDSRKEPVKLSKWQGR